jgi:hypothetical protein
MEILDDLNSIKWSILAEEGITKEALELVDLDIAFSPVIPIRGGEPMEAIELEGGFYRVPDCPFIKLNLTKEELTIMRYRYLINRKSRF